MLLKQTDYQRIYRVINSLLLNEGAAPEVCCIFFAGFGAYILEKHFNINAYPRAGLAVYNVGGANALFFGEEVNGRVTGENDGFHCWVEADGWVVDFMAPAFSRLSQEEVKIPSKMFQKPLSRMSPSPDKMANVGDFYLESTDFSTRKHMHILNNRPAYADLAQIAVQWFKKSPKKMVPSIQVGGKSNRLNTVTLEGETLVGTW